MKSSLHLALLSCFLLGFRHGFDYDHLAAITDITSLQKSWCEGMGLGLLYALGHAAIVAVLGTGVLLLHLRMPPALDLIGERLVGATLLLLAGYILASFFRVTNGHAPAARSRVAMLISSIRYLRWRLMSLLGRQRLKPDPFRFRYDRRSVFGIGVIHGLGAETPSQLLLFLLAAKLGGAGEGMIGLFLFLCGTLLMNTLMTASASGVFLGTQRGPRLLAGLNLVTAACSVIVGSTFLFGWSDHLPSLVR